MQGEMQPGESPRESASAVVAHERHTLIATEWKAPVPPPDVYNNYPEDAREFIIKTAQEENQHRRAKQTKALDAAIASVARGQHYPFAVALATIFVSGGLIYAGHSWGAVVMLGVIPATVAGVKTILRADANAESGGNKQ